MFRIKDRYELDLRVLGFSTTSNINWLNLKNELITMSYDEPESDTDDEEEESPKCIYHNTCGNDADYKTMNGKIDGNKSENWGELGYGNNNLYHWNLCGKCYKEESGEESDKEDECDDCEGKCKSNETEKCDDCGVELRIGCANNPSDHSIFNDYCDDCRVE